MPDLSVPSPRSSVKRVSRKYPTRWGVPGVGRDGVGNAALHLAPSPRSVSGAVHGAPTPAFAKHVPMSQADRHLLSCVDIRACLWSQSLRGPEVHEVAEWGFSGGPHLLPLSAPGPKASRAPAGQGFRERGTREEAGEVPADRALCCACWAHNGKCCSLQLPGRGWARRPPTPRPGPAEPAPSLCHRPRAWCLPDYKVGGRPLVPHSAHPPFCLSSSRK